MPGRRPRWATYGLAWPVCDEMVGVRWSMRTLEAGALADCCLRCRLMVVVLGWWPVGAAGLASGGGQECWLVGTAVGASLRQPQPAHWAVWPLLAVSLALRPCSRPATATTICTTHLDVRQHRQTTRGGKISARQAGAGQESGGGKEAGKWGEKQKQTHLNAPGTHRTASALPPVHPATGPSC